MDTKVQNKKSKYKIIIPIALVVVFLIGLLFYTHFKKSSLNVDSSRISVREVSKGAFDDMVILSGKIEPLHSVLINNIESGAVQEIFVEDGAMVEKGEPLMRLYNPNSELNYLQQETAIIEQINNLRNLKINLTNQELELEKELILIQHDYVDTEQKYELNKKLYDLELIPEKDYKEIAEQYTYQTKRKGIIETSVSKEKDARNLQIQAIDDALIKMEQNLEILRQNKENFIVLAAISGRISSFDPNLGQHIDAGESLGKIDNMDGYKIRAKVDEYYISRLDVGQSGTIETNNKTYEVEISKVLPEVKDGQFQVDMVFKNEYPKNLRMGMSFSVRLYLSESSESLLIPKGAFHYDTSGKWIFVLDGTGKAVRRNIKLGRENPMYFEVLDGLMEGERVITSSYSDYKKVEVLNLK